MESQFIIFLIYWLIRKIDEGRNKYINMDYVPCQHMYYILKIKAKNILKEWEFFMYCHGQWQNLKLKGGK